MKRYDPIPVPQEPAETWQDAQRFAARALDARSTLMSRLRSSHGEPRHWLSSVARTAIDGDVFARHAINVATAGGVPEFPFDAHYVQEEAKDLVLDECKTSGDLADAKARERLRARLARGMAGAAEMLLLLDGPSVSEGEDWDIEVRRAEREQEEGRVRLPRSEFLLRTHAYVVGNRMAPKVPLEASVLLVDRLENAEAEARVLARSGDDTSARAADILRGIVALLRKGGDDPLKGVVVPVDVRIPDDATTLTTNLAATIARMDDAGPHERAGGAFLLGAASFGFGSGYPLPWSSPPTFLAELPRAWERARDDDEDAGPINGREPVLRWRKSINAGLYALGHNADAVTNGARKKALARAKEAFEAARDGGGRGHES